MIVSSVLLGIGLIVLTWLAVASGTTVIASAPMNPVDEAGILSLHCQVRDLENDEEVKIVRTVGGRTERLSADKDIKSEAGDRYFLAVRQMADGTTVYFLSIMGVTRDDEGSYFCKVVKEGETSSVVVAVDSVHIGIMHFPDETEPLCQSSQSTTVISGMEITFNCSSALSNPPVSIRWSRTGTDTSIPKSHQGTGTNRVFSFIRFQPTVADTDTIFLCEISSPMFPGRIQTCHIGPIKVIPNNNADVIPTTIPLLHPVNNVPKPPLQHMPEKDCDSLCTAVSSPVLYWVIATIAASILSFIFLTVGVILMIKLCNLQQPLSVDSDYARRQQPHDKIYVELETKKPQDKLYMALAKNDRQTHSPMFARGNTTIDNTSGRPAPEYTQH